MFPDVDSLAVRADAIDRAGTSLGSRLAVLGRHATLRVVVRRLLLAVPLLFVVSVSSFLLVSLIPGDPAQQILGVDAPPEAYDKLRHELGLDQPLYQQYWHWLSNALHGDLGTSLFNSEPVTKTIGDRFPVTLSLIVCSLLVIATIGTALGVFAAVRGGFFGRLVDGLSLVGFALPGFWVGAVLIAIFAVRLRWFPAVGYTPLADSPSEWARGLVLPVAALALHSFAVVAKQTREAMMDVLASEHIRMSWANGIPRRYVYFRLSLKNASIRIVTIVGLQMIGLLGATLFVEQVFALPGLGSELVSATLQGDLPVVQGITVFFTLIVVVVNLAVDLAYTALDPRVRTS
jgi:peptide/nickel transport system permease protein